ncbi:uncharacterized protein LOC134694702 [Mytilus trossulus]|uniref:uncharacterized protein LOC134694702 n=1 Tax=Mytilus trossulus TaxID=6551 RepID=UPI003004C064
MDSMDDSLVNYSSRYEKICQRLARSLSVDDIKNLKFVLRNKVDQSDLSTITDGRELVHMLERKEILTEEKLPHVRSMLKNAGIDGVDDIIQSDYPLSSEGISKHDGFDVRSMNVVGNFKETKQLRKMIDIVETKRAVLVKGPNGSGKSQSAFWYARKFQVNDRSSVVWRVHCKSERSVYLSFATLMSHLKIECILSECDTRDCIKTMLDLAIENLTNQRNVTRKHLMILDDIESPEDIIVYNAMDRFITAENIYVIATSNKRFLSDHYEIYGMEMDKMTESEAMSLFPFSCKREEKQVKLLANNLDYLPLALSLAASYIKITHISIYEYNKNLLGSQLLADTLGTQSLAKSYSITLQRVDDEITNNSRRVLSLVPYLNHNNIAVTVLKSFLSDQLSRSEKEIEINKLLLVLTNYSLATVEGVGEKRILSMHGVSSLMIENAKSQEKVRQDVNHLLRHYCYYLDTDARLVESMKRNICFIHHAVLLLRKYCDLFEDSFESKVYESYLCCSIGVTFRLYGSTELSADDYFARAKQIIFNDIVCMPLPERALHTGDVTHLEDYLYGNLTEQEEARQVFMKLLEMSMTSVPLHFVEMFLTNKFRNEREIQLFQHYGKINPKEIRNNKLPLHIAKAMTLKDIIVPFANIRDTFLIDLLITLMNNSSKNKWWMEAAKVNLHARGRTLFTEQQIDSLTEFRFAHNLAQYLNNYYREHYPSCNPLASTVTKRNGILYFLRSNEKIESNELKDVIVTLDEMFNNSSATFYASFGVLKLAPKFNLHHRCLITRMLVKCYVKLWENDRDQNDLSEALFQAEKLVGLSKEMELWIVLTSIYLEIAQTYLLSPTKENIQNAKLHYKMACQKSKESGNIINTQYHLKMYQQYIDFCLKYGSVDDLIEAEQICLEMLERFIQNETKQTIQTQLNRIHLKISQSKFNRLYQTLKMSSMLIICLVIVIVMLWFGLYENGQQEL